MYVYVCMYLLVRTAENRRKLSPYNERLTYLASPDVPYKTKKRILVQEGDGFVQDLLVPVITTLGLMML